MLQRRDRKHIRAFVEDYNQILGKGKEKGELSTFASLFRVYTKYFFPLHDEKTQLYRGRWINRGEIKTMQFSLFLSLRFHVPNFLKSRKYQISENYENFCRERYSDYQTTLRVRVSISNYIRYFDMYLCHLPGLWFLR